MEISRLSQIVRKKICIDLSGQKIIYSGNKFTIIDNLTDHWILQITNENNVGYSWKVFSSYLSLFSLTTRELSNHIKSWIETFFKIRVNNIIRVNTDLKWTFENSLEKKMDIDLRKRFGFSYSFIKKMASLDRNPEGFYLLNKF